MKYAIMSDVHANPAALKKAYADAEEQKCEKFLFLGDVIGDGYDEKTAVDFLRDNFDVILMGNHESWSVDSKSIKPQDLRFDCENFSCVHGDCSVSDDCVPTFLDELCNLEIGSARITFSGHTHHACIWERNAKGDLRAIFDAPSDPDLQTRDSVTSSVEDGCRYIVNCGSVGYPKLDLYSTYAIYDSDVNRIEIRRLPFDFLGYFQSMLANAGMDNMPGWLLEEGIRRNNLGN